MIRSESFLKWVPIPHRRKSTCHWKNGVPVMPSSITKVSALLTRFGGKKDFGTAEKRSNISSTGSVTSKNGAVNCGESKGSSGASKRSTPW